MMYAIEMASGGIGRGCQVILKLGLQLRNLGGFSAGITDGRDS
jgi:hypothetical protein